MIAEDESASIHCLTRIQVSPTKPSYLQGEPIELKVTFINGSSKRVLLTTNHPTYRLLQLSDPSNRLVPRNYDTGDRFLDTVLYDTPGDSSLAEWLAPGAQRSSRIYLQDYFESPPSGTYEIQYEGSCFGPEVTGPTSSRGKILFQVKSSSEDDLKQLINRLDRQLRSGTDEQKDDAAGALTSMDTPLIIPVLESMMDVGLGSRPAVFQALSRFKGNPEAEEIINCGLCSNDKAAIAVFLKWKRKIPLYRYETIVKSKDQQTRIAALRYARVMNDPTYLPPVEELTRDSDPLVAEEARETKKNLEANKK